MFTASTVLLVLVAMYLVYTFLGAIVITVVDDRKLLMRWYDAQHEALHFGFWLAWPYFVARLFIHQASPHHEREL